MAIGDKADMLARINSYLPDWYGEDADNKEALLNGYAEVAAFIYSLQQYVLLQTRIATSTGPFLELINQDYLGGLFPRRHKENDVTYRKRLQINIIRPRNTRYSYIKVLEDLTGRTPLVWEGFKPTDTNWLNGGFVLNVNGLGSGTPYTIYILAFRPIDSGNAFNGLNNPSYSLNSGFVLGAVNKPYISDDDILQAVNSVHSAGITPIVWITN